MQWRVVAFHTSEQSFGTATVADPYSRCTTANSEHSFLIDTDDPEHMPEGWLDHATPPLARMTDISVYELHIRDFRWASHL